MNQIWFQYLNGSTGLNLWFDALIIFGAEYLGYLMLAGLGVFLLFKQEMRNVKMAVFALASALVARLVFTEIIRAFYFHPRPFILDIYQLVSHAPNTSFPSGHAAFFFGLAMGLWFFNRRLSAAFFIGAFLVGIFRVMAGIHWPYDIIGGAVAGIFSAFLLRYLNHRYKQKALPAGSVREEKILDFLDKEREIRNDDVERLLGVSDATATRYLDELENKGLIEQVGSGRGASYVRKKD